MTTATKEMTNAFSHPVSKKYFTIASQSINWMIAAITPEKTAPKSAPTTVPMMTIQMASVNFAFSFPTIALPDSHRTGDIKIVPTMILMTSMSKLIAMQIPLFDFIVWFFYIILIIIGIVIECCLFKTCPYKVYIAVYSQVGKQALNVRTATFLSC